MGFWSGGRGEWVFRLLLLIWDLRSLGLGSSNRKIWGWLEVLFGEEGSFSFSCSSSGICASLAIPRSRSSNRKTGGIAGVLWKLRIEYWVFRLFRTLLGISFVMKTRKNTYG